jgi:hypothetical protein
MSYFYQHPEFNVFTDLEECRNFVDWDILSSSQAVDKSFRFNPQLKIKERAWNDEIKRLLSDNQNQWNFKLLSHFESLYNQRWFLSQYKELLDWEWVSQYSQVLCTNDKNLLNGIIREYQQYLDFGILSKRPDISGERMGQIMRICPTGNYDYNALLKNHVISVTLKLIEKNPRYAWDWFEVTSANTFKPDVRFIYHHLRDNLNWSYLSEQDNQLLWGDGPLIIKLAGIENVSAQLNWHAITSRTYFPAERNVMSVLPLGLLNWNALSVNPNIFPLIEDYKDYIDWKKLSGIDKWMFKGDIDRYKDYIDWSVLCQRKDFHFSNELLAEYADYIDWKAASASLEIDFSLELVEQFQDKWHWPTLTANKAFHNKVDVTKLPFVRNENVVQFIRQFFPHKPKAYHFTHMSNAVKIIRSMKLQSRNYAEGQFSNSAGSNVYRRNDAHQFARFYFTPKSPTQFYNEFLGKDSDLPYYDRAYRLDLPKCPMPVFFVFDIEELLAIFPDKCYYSTGNMQKDSTRYYKVIEDPTHIKAKEIYRNSWDTKAERQQEFLVEGELDFSKLSYVEISCYNQTQADLLKQELIGTKWEDVVSVNPTLYDGQNKQLQIEESDDTISISSNYVNPYQLKIEYSKTIPTIINKTDVKSQKQHSIFVSSRVEIRKDVPFEVYFEVESPRKGSWLIYKNE